ncbi:MAG: BBE domain-containing protein, partial [Planctomycetota bacterium]
SAARFAEGEEWLRLLRPARDERIYSNYQTYAAPAGATAIYGVNHSHPAATAFPHRQAHSVHLRLATTWADPAESAARFAEGEEWLRLLRPARDERIYSNYQTYAAPAGAAAIYGVNHSRLAALKARHDPDNLFRRNANVPPASG